MKVLINCIDRKDGNIREVLEKDLVEYSEWLERAINREYVIIHTDWMGKDRIDVLATRDNEKCEFVVEFIEEEETKC